LPSNCPEKDFQLPDWEDQYGDQRLVTDEMLRAYHRSLCYLKEEIELIDARTGPKIRNTLTPPFHDDQYSFGYSTGTVDGQPAYSFDESTSASVVVDFGDFASVSRYVDMRRTDAEIAIEDKRLRLPDYEETEIVQVLEHEMRTEKKVVMVETQVWTGTQWQTQSIPREVEIPITHQEVYYENTTTTVEMPIMAWPDSENVIKGSDVEWRPGCKSWCENTVILAQTFQAPADATIKRLYLGIKKPPKGGKPLYVGIAAVDANGRPKITIKDHKCPGLKIEGFLFLTDSSKMTLKDDVAVFEVSVPIKKNQYYAIVIYTEEEQDPKAWRALGVRKAFNKGRSWMYWNQNAGWQALSGTRDGKTVTGSICFRIDAITTVTQPKQVIKQWIEYTHATVYDEVQVGYPTLETVLVPKEIEYTYDYWYFRDVPTTVTRYASDKYVYLRPIRTNPVHTVILKPTDSKPSGTDITYQVGVPGASGITWYDLTSSNNYTASFSTPTTILLFRAKLATTNSSNTPYISKLSLELRMSPAMEMYIVSEEFTPPLVGILTANVWSEADAVYEKNPATTVTVDIAKHEKIIYQEPVSYVDEYTGDGSQKTFYTSHKPVFTASEVVKIDNVTKTRGTDYTIDYDAGKVEAFLEEMGGAKIEISYSVSQIDLPVRSVLEGSVVITLQDDETLAPLYEYDDYIVDYENAIITLYKDLDGVVHVQYIPLVATGLSLEDGTLPARLDAQRWATTADGSASTFTLPFVPIDPIAMVQIDDMDLAEDEDFTVDYTTGEITFTSTPAEGSRIEVIYTPNIRDQSLRVGIRAARNTTDGYAHIYKTRISYRP